MATTATKILSLLMQPYSSVPVKTYQVIIFGLAWVIAAWLLLNVAAGCHRYCAAPVAIKLAVKLAQEISFDLLAFTRGNGFTIT